MRSNSGSDVAGGLQLLRHQILAGHRERTRAAADDTFFDRREVAQHDVLRQRHPWIVLDRPPHDHRHDAAGLEAPPHVAQAGHGVLEELRAEAREAEIVDRFERIGLHVGGAERDVGQSRGLCVAPAGFEEWLAAVDAQHRPGRADASGDLDRGVAPPASHVDDAVALADLERGEDLGAVQAQSAHQDVLVLGEFGNEDLVPELDRVGRAIQRFSDAHDDALSLRTMQGGDFTPDCRADQLLKMDRNFTIQ